MRLAEAQGDPSMRVDGLLVLGSSTAFTTAIQPGLDLLDTAIALAQSISFNPDRGLRRPLERVTERSGDVGRGSNGRGGVFGY